MKKGKRIIGLMMAAVCLTGALTGCGSDESQDKSSEAAVTETTKENKTASEAPAERDPMPAYEKHGVNNSMATSDGRYIYYTYLVDGKNEHALYRCDMDFNNPQDLNEKNRRKLYNPVVIDGYLYLSSGKSAERVDIATAPNYFDGKDGRVYSESFFDEKASEEIMGVKYTVADDEYLYFVSSGICRVKKDGTGFEKLLAEEGRYNFYDLKYWNGKLYAYCGDDQKLYSMNTDGSGVSEVCKMMESFVIYEGNAYYIFSGDNHAQQLTKTNLETGETETIAVLGEGWVSADLKNAMDGKLYYVYDDEDDVYTLRTYDIESGEVITISSLEGSPENLDVVGNYIFFENEDKLMKMNLDGTDLVQLEQ